MIRRFPFFKLRERDGPLTSQLVREPADFGLGQVPFRQKPAMIAKSICGFCSTGCGLKIHLDAKGQAINLTADTDYPVNQGMACPKGWEALTPLAAKDRLTSPLLRDKTTGKLEPVTWERALAAFVENFQGIQRQHGPHSL